MKETLSECFVLFFEKQAPHKGALCVCVCVPRTPLLRKLLQELEIKEFVMLTFESLTLICILTIISQNIEV